jgi:hypothetical protein
MEEIQSTDEKTALLKDEDFLEGLLGFLGMYIIVVSIAVSIMLITGGIFLIIFMVLFFYIIIVFPVGFILIKKAKKIAFGNGIMVGMVIIILISVFILFLPQIFDFTPD